MVIRMVIIVDALTIMILYFGVIKRKFDKVLSVFYMFSSVVLLLIYFVAKPYLLGCCYCPPMKLLEVNVFICVHLFIILFPGGGSHVIPGHGTSGAPIPAPLATDIWWPLLETCSNLLTSGPLPIPAGANFWWLLKQVRSAQAGGTHRTGMLSCFSVIFAGMTKGVNGLCNLKENIFWAVFNVA